MTEGWTDKYSKNGTNRVMQSEVIQRRKKKIKIQEKNTALISNFLGCTPLLSSTTQRRTAIGRAQSTCVA